MHSSERADAPDSLIQIRCGISIFRDHCAVSFGIHGATRGSCVTDTILPDRSHFHLLVFGDLGAPLVGLVILGLTQLTAGDRHLYFPVGPGAGYQDPERYGTLNATETIAPSVHREMPGHQVGLKLSLAQEPGCRRTVHSLVLVALGLFGI